MINRCLAASTLAALLIAAAALPVAAHVELVSSVPEDGATLDEPPTEVVIVFDGEVQVDGSGFTVTDADGTEAGSGEVDLDVAERNELRGEVTIDEPGEYTMAWTVVAEDGDEQSGELTFTLAGEAEASPAPSTALPPPSGPSPLTIVGIVLVLVAAGLAVRRALT